MPRGDILFPIASEMKRIIETNIVHDQFLISANNTQRYIYKFARRMNLKATRLERYTHEQLSS